MKKNLLLTILFCYAFAKAVTAQATQYTSQDVIGQYTKEYTANENSQSHGSLTTLKRSFTLNTDKTFEFHNYRKLAGQDEEHWYARGSWSLEGKVITLTSTATDVNDTYNVNLNNSKLRFFKKSPRNKSAKSQPTYVQFFESDYKVARGLKLFQTDE